MYLKVWYHYNCIHCYSTAQRQCCSCWRSLECVALKSIEQLLVASAQNVLHYIWSAMFGNVFIISLSFITYSCHKNHHKVTVSIISRFMHVTVWLDHVIIRLQLMTPNQLWIWIYVTHKIKFCKDLITYVIKLCVLYELCLHMIMFLKRW